MIAYKQKIRHVEHNSVEWMVLCSQGRPLGGASGALAPGADS
jgi:hypothetical protein